VDTSEAAVKAREDQAQASFDKIEAAMSDTKIADKEGKEGKEGKKKKKKSADDEEDDPFGDKAEIESQRKEIGTEVKEACEKSAAGEVDAAIKMLTATSSKHKLQPNDLFGFIFDVAFDDDAVKQLKTHQKLLTKLMKASPDKTKTAKFLLSPCVENLVGAEGREALLKKTPNLLKTLYDMDLVEEDVIIKWFDKGSKKKLPNLTNQSNPVTVVKLCVFGMFSLCSPEALVPSLLDSHLAPFWLPIGSHAGPKSSQNVSKMAPRRL